MLKQNKSNQAMIRLITMDNVWQGHYISSPYASSSYLSEKVVEVLQYEEASERNRALREAIRVQISSNANNLLPFRISIIRGDAMASVRASGRGAKPLVAQLKAQFTMQECSPYKQHKPYKVQTGLWKVEGRQTLFYGTLGISNAEGFISRDNADLLLIRTSDWKELDIFIFKGLAGLNKQLDALPDAVKYVESKYVHR